MKGYIYTMYAGADPGQGWVLNDPIFGKTPTLGACVPNIRRNVAEGDYIFAISGRVTGVRQFVVGGFQVAEKIDALAAYARFPENRLSKAADGTTRGNIIVDKDGNQVQFDAHSNFERRLDNYIVGRDPVMLETSQEIDKARKETLYLLRHLFNKKGERVFDIIGRHRKLEERQVADVLSWIDTLKG